MGPNFDDYPSFQPKTTPAQRYATQCTYFFTEMNEMELQVIILFNNQMF